MKHFSVSLVILLTSLDVFYFDWVLKDKNLVLKQY